MLRWFEARGAHCARECPVCRTGWREDDPTLPWTETCGDGTEVVADLTDEGYLNLASLQPGTQTVRDQSTYSEWLGVHQRQREHAAMVYGTQTLTGAAGNRASHSRN